MKDLIKTFADGIDATTIFDVTDSSMNYDKILRGIWSRDLALKQHRSGEDANF